MLKLEYILTEQRNCEILKLLQIYKNDKKSKFMLTRMYIIKTSTQNGQEVVTHIAHMMYGRKEGLFTVSHN